MSASKLKKQHIISFILTLILSVLVYALASIKHVRLDLSSDKRYTLAPTTQDLVKSVDDYLYIQVFLEGESLPAELNQLKREAKIMLSELRSLNSYVEFEFVDPLENKSQEEVKRIIKQMAEKGISVSTMLISEGDSREEKIFFPWALFQYKGKEIPINLLKSNPGASTFENLSNSINALEYEWVNAIKQSSTSYKPLVGFLKGHGELNQLLVDDFQQSIKENYRVKEYNIREMKVDSLTGQPTVKSTYNILRLFDVMIVAKPQKRFTDLDKLMLDQYIMHGGKVLWLIDPVQAEMDSMANKSEMIAFPKRELNLTDMLFKYGVRINSNLVKDVVCSKISLPTSTVNGQARWSLHPWYYFPLVYPEKNSPITNNLDAVKMEFTSNIDLIRTKGIKKTPLLKSSPRSGLQQTPSRIALTEAIQAPEQKKYQAGQQVLAYLLEGTFTSFYKNKISPDNSLNIKMKDQSEDSKMIVVADGDIIKNPIRAGQSMPLGYDRYTNRTYANKKFLKNCLSYLLENKDIIKIRNREVKLRMLDKSKIAKTYTFWQSLNILLPLGLLFSFALLSFYIRKRKYTR
ncbi:MAG: gliding motility-associated ABC transporter substrate-binding protein GldG [Flavobacteriales bacterium]